MSELPDVSPRYRLIELSGQGAQCAVYRAIDLSSGRTVAVKLPRPDLSAIDAERAIRHEISAGKHEGWRSPAVAQLLDQSTTHDGAPFIVTEWVDGKTLGDYLRERGPMSPASLILLFTPLAHALDKAHRAGLRHGDLKPSNLMIAAGDAPRAVLIDFGLAQDSNVEATMTSAVRGTPRYLAPELINANGQADYRADLYAFAAILYESLTGKPLFAQTDTPALLYAHVHTPPPAPSEANPALPVPMDNVFTKALAKDPSTRFPSATALLDAIYATLARPQSQSRNAWAQARIVGLALIGLLALAGVVWSLTRQPTSFAAQAPTPPTLSTPSTQETPSTQDQRPPETASIMFSPGTASGGAMLFEGGALYVPDGLGRIHKIDPNGGNAIWPAITLDPLLTSPPMLIGGLLIATNEQGQGQAWDLNNAAPRWSQRYDYSIQAFPLGDRILLMKYETVQAIDPYSGLVTAVYTRTNEDGWNTSFGVTGDGAFALVSTWSGLFQRLTLNDGGITLETVVKDVPDSGDLTGPPIVAYGAIAASYKRGAIRVWNEDGTLRWQTEINETITAQPTLIRVSDELVQVIVGAEDGSLRAFNANDGAPLWTYRFGAAVQNQPVAWRDEGVIVAATNGEVALVDLGNGEARQTWQVGGSVRVPIIVDADNGRAFVRANDVWIIRRS
jgi:serine/threonine protein kinase